MTWRRTAPTRRGCTRPSRARTPGARCSCTTPRSPRPSGLAAQAQSGQVPKISRVWLTSAKPCSAAIARVQRSTVGPSTSTVAAAAAADQVVVVRVGAAPVDRLAVLGAQHVDLAGVGEPLQGPVDRGQPDRGRRAGRAGRGSPGRSGSRRRSPWPRRPRAAAWSGRIAAAWGRVSARHSALRARRAGGRRGRSRRGRRAGRRRGRSPGRARARASSAVSCVDRRRHGRERRAQPAPAPQPDPERPGHREAGQRRAARSSGPGATVAWYDGVRRRAPARRRDASGAERPSPRSSVVRNDRVSCWAVATGTTISAETSSSPTVRIATVTLTAASTATSRL